MKQKNKGRMTLTLLLSASVFVVTLVTLLIIGLVLLVQIFQSVGTWLANKCDKRLRGRK